MGRAARPRELVTLRGETNELHVAPHAPEHGEQLLSLVDGAAQILLGVQDQEGAGHVRGVGERRDPSVRVRLFPRSGPDVSTEEPGKVGGAVFRGHVVHRPFRDGATEPIGVPDDP